MENGKSRKEKAGSHYLFWDQVTISDFRDNNIAQMYDRGYVFTRLGKGVMQQTRSVRVDLGKFEPSSENRRILKKTEDIVFSGAELPYAAYDFRIGKMAKDFYSSKFGDGTMSANKIKEIMTEPAKSNFNCLFMYKKSGVGGPIGYAICYTSELIHHYSYPFYDLEASPKDMGLGMMIRAMEFSKSLGHKHFYLGSLQRPGDIYKLQFTGLEWFDGKKWETDITEAKRLLSTL